MTVQQFRRLALAFEGAEEGSHMNHPDFRVGGRIFASLGYPTADDGCVLLTADQQQDFVNEAPTVFVPAAGAWGRAGGSLVNLAAAEEDLVGAALTLAWRNAVAKGPSKPAKAKAAKRVSSKNAKGSAGARKRS